jgi:hypothetical protein|uniref:Outer membrane protein beta-barrel domain-containing protein n=1 Tax=Leptospirillum ferrodiazotrophum TaxID=412449 RepID=C6HV08_9BACT|nr:MAG: protein of unknown function [Leptospirillum ferrodiazotrophum]
MAKEGTLLSFRESSRRFVKSSVLSVALLSAAFVAAPAFAGEALTPPTPSSTSGLPSSSNPATSSTAGQMMAMQQAVMAGGASGNSSFDGNVPKSTSLSANFGWMDTFDNSVFGGGYGGGVTATHWITSKFALQASIEIESFGLTWLNNTVYPGPNNSAGTPVIPITLGGLYDFTGGKAWVNPQVFLDGGPAVTLNGGSMPLYADIGVGVTTPLARLSDTLAGINLFANIRMAYLSNMGGLADTAVAADLGSKTPIGGTGQDMFYMPIEFGATFVF